jgi:hypothetical protein
MISAPGSIEANPSSLTLAPSKSPMTTYQELKGCLSCFQQFSLTISIFFSMLIANSYSVQNTNIQKRVFALIASSNSVSSLF